MGEGECGVRLRQAVLVARELEPAAERLKVELGLGEPFADSNVAEFGLRNAVFALGDAFLEVISDESGVDPGADRAGEDDEVRTQLGERHVTITVPSMSLLCSVQT